MQDEAVFGWLKPYLLLVMPSSSKLAIGYRQSAMANFYLAFSPARRRWFVLPREFDCCRQTLFQCMQVTLADDQPLRASLALQKNPDDWELLEFHVNWPADSCWGLSGLPVNANSICMVSASHKLLVVYHDIGGKPFAVLKVPESAPVSRGIRAEAETLEFLSKQAIGIAPGLLKSGHSSYPGDGECFSYSLQQYIAGSPPRRLTLQDAVRYLNRLSTDRPPVSMRQLAAVLERKIDDLPLKGISRDRLQRIRKTVKCPTALPLSLYHGDFKHRNLIVSADDQLMAIDWEFSNQIMPVSFDLIRLLLDDQYNNFAIRNFKSMYQPRMKQLQGLVKVLYPQNTPPLDQLLALQFCQHFVDRVAGFDGVTNANMRRLEGILETPWITRASIANARSLHIAPGRE